MALIVKWVNYECLSCGKDSNTDPLNNFRITPKRGFPYIRSGTGAGIMEPIVVEVPLLLVSPYFGTGQHRSHLQLGSLEAGRERTLSIEKRMSAPFLVGVVREPYERLSTCKRLENGNKAK